MEPTSQPFLLAASRDRSAKTTFHIPSPHMHNEIICLHTVTVSPGACNQLTHAHKAHGSVFPEVLWPARSTACPQKLGYVDNKQVGKKKKKKIEVNKQCVGPSQQSELKQGSTSNKRSQTKLAGAALQASTVAEALSLYYREPHTLICKPGSKWLQQV